MLDEVPKVLGARWRPSSWREKEWWFGTLHDPAAGVHLSWSCVRAWYAERFRAWLVDLHGDGEAVLDRPLRFDRRQDGPWLDLRKGGVPIIDVHGELVSGFDQPKLNQLLGL